MEQLCMGLLDHYQLKTLLKMVKLLMIQRIIECFQDKANPLANDRRLAVMPGHVRVTWRRGAMK
jgi:hypothetical protein